MALVNISEAARLAGKNRTTIYKYINNGKLSIIVDGDNNKKIDISELLRVFPNIKINGSQQHVNVENKQSTTDKINNLKTEIKYLQQMLDAKNKHIESLNSALLLLDDKTKEKPPVQKKWWKLFK